MVTLATTARLQSVQDNLGLLCLIKMDHAALSAPIRLVNDTRNLVALGDTWLAIPMSITLPSDKAGESPRARLQFDNVGRDLTAELERLPPGAQLEATLIWLHRATPAVVEYEFKTPLTSVQVNPMVVTATMGSDALMRRPAVLLRFDPVSAPGVFAE